jgi:trehalose-6-phosphate synthase
MVTSIRDGLCLLPFEYITVRKANPGFIIVSEFSGIGSELISIKRVNPFDITQLSNALTEVLTESALLC